MKICSEENDNSVKYYEHFHYKDKFVIVMELCDNSLQKILDERKEGFTCEQIFNIMSQLNNTFKIMYKNKIIHRDIKLDNILVKYKDNNNNDSNINFIVKLTDYGISKQLKNTINTTLMGTPETMAPEILEGEENYDNKCDLWSIGIIIYQLYFKEYPYKGKTQVAIYNQIKQLGKKILKKTKNEKLDNLIDSLLIREPEKRINYEDYFNHPFFKENYIESEIEIKFENRNIRIINSYEEWYKNNIRDEFKEEYCNEKEIKENCEIKINNEIIPFSYFYEFKNKGKYKIKYSFKNNLKNTNYMFSSCSDLTNINLSNFNTQNITNMSDMFSHCKALININLSNFNTHECYVL
jgi:surface protein